MRLYILIIMFPLLGFAYNFPHPFFFCRCWSIYNLFNRWLLSIRRTLCLRVCVVYYFFKLFSSVNTFNLDNNLVRCKYCFCFIKENKWHSYWSSSISLIFCLIAPSIIESIKFSDYNCGFVCFSLSIFVVGVLQVCCLVHTHLGLHGFLDGWALLSLHNFLLSVDVL